jgi:hypothetical protein
MIGILLGVYFGNNVDTTKENKILNNLCPDLDQNNRFKNEGMLQSLNYSMLIGSHYGIMLLSSLLHKFYPNKEDEINEWNYVCFKHNINKILICALTSIPMLGYMFNNSSSLAMIALLKIFFPLFVTIFNLYGTAIIIIIRYKYANPLIYEQYGNSVNRRLNYTSRIEMKNKV